MDAIGPDGVAIIPAATEQTRNSDVHYRFRQDSDFRYLTGFPEPDAWAVLAPGHADGEFVMFCRPRDKAREQWDGYRAGPEGCVARYGADRAEVIADLDSKMPELLKDREVVHFTSGWKQANDVSLQRWLGAVRAMVRTGVQAPTQVHQIGAILHEQRLRKDDSELATMRRAAAVTDAAHRAAMRVAKPGGYEFEVEAEILRVFRKAGCERPAYGPIVGSGPNATILHHRRNDRHMQQDDLLLIDAGCELDYYASDVTRTFPVNGRYSDAQRKLYDVVLAAQLAAVDAVRPGARFLDVHQAALKHLCEGLVELGLLEGPLERVLEEQTYTRFYMHKTGHWLGMDVHDVGDYKVGDEWRVFEPGMVTTVEPGLYLASTIKDLPQQWWNIGIRIEDDVLELQGDCVEKVADVLLNEGFKVRKG